MTDKELTIILDNLRSLPAETEVVALNNYCPANSMVWVIQGTFFYTAQGECLPGSKSF